ncbi:hypothetical protein BegalDRAFT_2592 [Beggiatoa alba B18LD]|uniref:Integral membrane protein n=1 Tax=Beggiatoa alba B18LD TaxID=395493 RepID=I3CIJ1_9GAMM|nr:hypothetical protein [Beggiatoa alba]EIJ43434.1 hypothetical protein BegalDRAFT_2592 [Beggiatoa alba B18LD]
MKKSTSISLLLIAPSALTLIGCSDNNVPKDLSFKDRDECSIYYSSHECDKIVSQSRPMFEKREACENYAGVGKCETTAWQGQAYWMPLRNVRPIAPLTQNTATSSSFSNTGSSSTLSTNGFSRWYVPADVTTDITPRRAISTSNFAGKYAENYSNNSSTTGSYSGNQSSSSTSYSSSSYSNNSPSSTSSSSTSTRNLAGSTSRSSSSSSSS